MHDDKEGNGRMGINVRCKREASEGGEMGNGDFKNGENFCFFFAFYIKEIEIYNKTKSILTVTACSNIHIFSFVYLKCFCIFFYH